MHYLHFALLTVVCWGTYGVCMHVGSTSMGDKENGRLMAFLWVGLAYFLTAVIAPLIILKLKGANIFFWTYPIKGWQWSLLAGTLGAIGALGVLLAFGKMPSPAFVPVIMSIIFAGAPMVNALVSTTKDGNWAFVRWPFVLGIALAAIGGYMITKHAPKPPKPVAVVEASNS
ncbi:MAG: hypothetical protein P8M67_03200 [Opitutales bacterium]|nr:hypothetical protein [Opitutales bacterium]